jgi:hypothetical protein
MNWRDVVVTKRRTEMNRQSSLVAAGNASNPSLIVLRERGYDLWLEKADDGSSL